MGNTRKPGVSIAGEVFSYPFDDIGWKKVCNIPKKAALEWINTYIPKIETLTNKYAIVVCVDYYGFKQHITAIYNKDNRYCVIKKIEEV